MNKVAALAIAKIGTIIRSRESAPKSLGLIRRSRRTKCGGASYSDRQKAGLSKRAIVLGRVLFEKGGWCRILTADHCNGADYELTEAVFD